MNKELSLNDSASPPTSETKAFSGRETEKGEAGGEIVLSAGKRAVSRNRRRFGARLRTFRNQRGHQVKPLINSYSTY